MTIQYWFRDPDGHISGPITEFDDDRVRLYTADFSMSAEEGTALTSQFTVDDPVGTFNIGGLRAFGVQETALGSNGFIYVGYTQARVVKRGVYRTEFGAQWDVNVVDINTLLARRVMIGTDCNRPAETDVQRVQWLVSTAEGGLIRDTRYLSTAAPVAMDAVDYRGQMFNQILDDCAQQSGKNYYLTYFGDTASTYYPWGNYSLWYGDAGLAVYDSTIRLSNVLSDVDSVTTFAVDHETTQLTRDPSRVFSGVYVSYDGGNTYTESADTYNDFSRRDGTFRAENVKTVAKAQARATRYLNTIDTEEDVIKTSFQVPAAYVNHLREGMRVSAKFAHLPGYQAFSWMRVLNRQVVQDSELTYKITVELSASPTPDTPGGSPSNPAVTDARALITWPIDAGATDGSLYFQNDGDHPAGGDSLLPLVGPFAYVGGVGARTGIRMTADNVISIHFHCDANRAYGDSSDHLAEAWGRIFLNGTLIAEEYGSLVIGFPHNFGPVFDMNVTGLIVATGDIVTATYTVTYPPGSPTAPGVPAGAGSGNNQISVTAGIYS